MDLVDKDDPERKKFAQKKEEIMKVDKAVMEKEKDKDKAQGKGLLRVFPTTIWDESLYKVGQYTGLRLFEPDNQAWSSVIHTLVPNIGLITSHLTFLRDLCLAVEIVVFEAETFLVIAKSGSPLDADASELDRHELEGGAEVLDKQRFEKTSEIVKGFRKTCQ
jgi:Ras-related GTP-binding protein A/B